MKKLFILIICLTITGWLQAQYCDSLDNHLAGHYHMDVWDAIELSDGNILVVAWQDSLNTYDNTQEYFPYLKKFYKISRPDLTIIDSFSFEATDRRYKVMARCHRQDSKYNNLVIDVINVDNQSYLNIAFFDDDLNFNDEMEVTTLLSNTNVYALYGTLMTAPYGNRICMLDSNDDIVMVYYDLEQLETHFARFGLDGTLKHDQMYPSNVMPMIGGWVRVSGLTQYSTDPIGYNYFGVVASDHWGQGYNWGYELDSMFNITNTFFLQETNPPGYPYHTFSGMHDCMTSLGDGTACFARNVRRKPEIWTLGLEKVDTTGQVLKEVWFKPIPRRHGGGSCIGLQRDYKGYICYSYVSLSMDSVNYIACIKLDENLNIIWERYNMKDIDEFLRDTNSGMRVLDNGAMMVFGNTNYLHWNWNNMAAPWLEPFLSGMYMIIWDEIPVGIPETETNIRPYLMYPIPVNDQLHIHYSPDITPSSIVIYDIQGRLVRTVNNDFESLSMEGLASGQYVMKVTMEDGKVFTDKVIKE